jgi:hypothetical protein
MPDDDKLDKLLAGLAQHTRQSGRLRPVEQIRRRGLRRRRNRTAMTIGVGVVLVGVVGVGAALARPATGPDLPPGGPATTGRPSVDGADPSGGPTAGGPDRDFPVAPSQNRKVALRAVDGAPDRLLSIGPDAAATTVEVGRTEREHFVFVPLSPASTQYWLTTGWLTDGEPLCLAAAADRLVALACDAADARQFVQLVAVPGATFGLLVGGYTLTVEPAGAPVLRSPADATAPTGFAPVDAGAAPARPGD